MLVKAIVYLYPTIEDAENSQSKGATGFIVNMAFERKFGDAIYQHAYLVTNRHVVDADIKVVRLNRFDGGTDSYLIPDGSWFFHPDGDDIAITNFRFDRRVYDHLHLLDTMFITKDFIQEQDIGIGDDVFTIGRFKFHEGRKRNLPSALFGNIAQMPEEKILVRQATNYTALQEAFLAEMRSIGGYSGSPAFVYLAPYTHRMTKEPRGLDNKFYTRLLGIDSGHLPTEERIKDKDGKMMDGWRVEGNSAMAVVIPAWKLQELLDIDELKQQRSEYEEKAAQVLSEGGAISNVTVPDDNEPSSA